MPGPVLFGTFIDKTCNLWEKRCDETGACLEYNNAQLSYLILAAGLLFQGRRSVCVSTFPNRRIKNVSGSTYKLEI